MSKRNLLGLLSSQKKTQPDAVRRRDKKGYTLKDAKEEANTGWKLYRGTAFARAFTRFQKYALGGWIVFYAFLQDIIKINNDWSNFLGRDEVQAGAVAVSTAFMAGAYLAGPIWWGIFWTIIVCFGAASIFGVFS